MKETSCYQHSDTPNDLQRRGDDHPVLAMGTDGLVEADLRMKKVPWPLSSGSKG